MPLGLFFNQLLKFKSVGRCQLCLTVCIDQASLRLGGSILTAWFNRLTLFRSSLNYNDLKTATRPDMAGGESNDIFRIVHLKCRKSI